YLCDENNIIEENSKNHFFDEHFKSLVKKVIPNLNLQAIYSANSLLFIETQQNTVTTTLQSLTSENPFTFNNTFTYDWYSLFVLFIYIIGILANCYLAHRLIQSELVIRKLNTVGNFLRRSARFSQVARWLNGRSSGGVPVSAEAVQTAVTPSHPRIGTFSHTRADIVRNSVELQRLNNENVAPMVGSPHREVPVDVVVGGVTPVTNGRNNQLVRSGKSTRF
ncbi:hypothetical protein TYRP_017649, partial [Tyrophagus putrescentiae]